MERRNTRQRQLVLEAVRDLHDHPTADEVYLLVRERDAHVSRGTVYRNLHVLADAGDILSVKMPGGERFDLRTDRHAHLVCTECGRVVDVPTPSYGSYCEKVARQTGYAGVRVATLLSGVCPACQAKARQAAAAQDEKDGRAG